jgi:outer membrane receptor for ferrienterochelin and colicins
MNHNTLFLGLCPLALSYFAYAESSPTMIETIHIIAQQEGAEARQDSTVPKVIISEQEVEHYGDATVGDVLRRTVGMSFTGPAGVTKDVRMRGLEKGYTLYLINGEAVPSATKDRQFQVDRIPADMIERIEIIRNPSAEYSSEAVGGIINIILKSEIDEMTRLRVGYGRNGDLDVGDAVVQRSKRIGAVEALLALSHTVGAEDVIEYKEKYDAKEAISQTESKTKPVKKSETLLSPRLTWNISDKRKLTLEPWLSDGKEDKNEQTYVVNSSNVTTKSVDKTEDKTDRLSRIAAKFEQKESWGNWSAKAGMQKNKTEKEKIETEKDLVKVTQKLKTENTTDAEDHNYVGLNTNFYLWEAHNTTLGVEYREQNFDTNKLSFEDGKQKVGVKDQYSVREDRWIAFVQHEWKFLKKHSLNMGVRHERLSRDTVDSTQQRKQDDDNFTTPSLHYRYALGAQINLRASASQTVKFPKFDQLNPLIETNKGTILEPDKGGNAQLQPEKANAYELGTEYFFADKKGLFGLNLYQRDVSDYVDKQVLLEQTRYVERPYNVGDAKFWGAEFEFRAPLILKDAHEITLTLNHSEMRGEIERAGVNQKIEVKDMPMRITNLGIDYVHSATGINFGLQANYTPKYTRTSINDDFVIEEKSRNTSTFLDMYVGKRFGKQNELRLVAKNLLSVDKEETTRKFKTDGSVDSHEKKVEKSDPTVYLTFETRF